MSDLFRLINLSGKVALRTLRHSLLRSLLTMFGIVIGIAMVILVLSAGGSVKRIILSEVSSFGNNWIHVEVKIPETGKNSSENARGQAQGVMITTLTRGDAEAIGKIPNIKNTYASVTNQAAISYREEKTRTIIFGVTASYPDIDKSVLAEGRFFTDEEDKSAENVVVLGHEVKKNIFGDQDPLGRQVKIDKHSYLVIGVMEELGATGFFNRDTLVYMPLRTVQEKIMGIDHVLWIMAEMHDVGAAEATAEEIRYVMRERHDISDPDKEDFAVMTMDEALALVDTIVKGITWLLIALASISLLVGGVGIMNMMYVSVAERTFEIGLRRAVGASRVFILWQFLIEAVLLTLFGGLGGIIIGTAIASLIAIIAGSLGYDWTFSLSFFSIILSVGFCTAVGIIFGLYPARRAAVISPIEALRQE